MLVVFIDDILIYNTTWIDHINHIRETFAIMDKRQFKVKLSKCSFAQQSLHYLDRIISQHDVPADPAKVAAIQSWPTPRNIKEVRSFLGLAHYYRKFVQHFDIISLPLTSLLKKGHDFGWHSEQELAFQALKTALTTDLVLAFPDFTKPLEIETDACEKGDWSSPSSSWTSFGLCE